MEEKEIQPSIQMKNSSVIIVKTQLVLYSVYFSFCYSLPNRFVNQNVQNVKREKKNQGKNNKRPSFMECFLHL